MIRRHGSGFQVVVYLGRDPVTGRERRVTRKLGEHTAAVAFETTLKAEIERVRDGHALHEARMFAARTRVIARKESTGLRLWPLASAVRAIEIYRRAGGRRQNVTTTLAELADVTTRTARRWVEAGAIPGDHHADAIAVALGTHPALLWGPSWWDPAEAA